MRCMSWSIGCLALVPTALAAQTVLAGDDTAAVAATSDRVLDQARSLQARFERERVSHLPTTFSSGGGSCDEIVGRMCWRDGEGEWIPTPEPDDVRALRADLLRGLDSLQALAPADAWIVGQRVWYRGESGDWSGALEVVRMCGGETWWCSALEGLALHGLRRYGAADAAFERALDAMDGELALEWRVPDRAVDSDARRILETAVTAADGSLELVLDRLWSLADPLYLVEGNDRRTAHFARWTVATLKDGAANPYRLRWGTDLEELTIRHGWEIGWERSWPSRMGGQVGVTGHKDHEARDYLPSGWALADPASATSADLLAHNTRPRSLYTPPYAPVLLPMDGQVALFPRGERLVVVATQFLPEDTTTHAEHDHPKPWMDAGDQADLPDRVGLYALPLDGGPPVPASSTGSTTGALMVDVPAGPWVISAESWSPASRRAGRLRVGVHRPAAPPDVAVLSDLLLVTPGGSTATRLEDALVQALPMAEIDRDAGLGVAFEVSGIGYRDETLGFRVVVERTDRGVLRRVGEFLGLASRPASVSLAWEEPGPERPGLVFRHLDLGLPPLDPGVYVVTLTLVVPGRSDVMSRRAFRVR